MCAGDAALYNLDSVDITLTREQAKNLRRLMQVWVDGAIAEGINGPHCETAKRILEQLPKESA